MSHVICIAGTSGAGKTTLTRAMARRALFPPHQIPRRIFRERGQEPLPCCTTIGVETGGLRSRRTFESGRHGRQDRFAFARRACCRGARTQIARCGRIPWTRGVAVDGFFAAARESLSGTLYQFGALRRSCLVREALAPSRPGIRDVCS